MNGDILCPKLFSGMEGTFPNMNLCVLNFNLEMRNNVFVCIIKCMSCLKCCISICGNELINILPFVHWVLCNLTKTFVVMMESAVYLTQSFDVMLLKNCYIYRIIISVLIYLILGMPKCWCKFRSAQRSYRYHLFLVISVGSYLYVL